MTLSQDADYMTFSGRFIDTNVKLFQDLSGFTHSHSSAWLQPAAVGLRVTIEHACDSLGLDAVLGCAPRSYSHRIGPQVGLYMYPIVTSENTATETEYARESDK